MAKTKISEYSTTNSSNSDIEGINIAEGCAPSGINNAIRELMVHLKEFQTGTSSDPLTVAGSFVASGGATLSGTNTLSGANIISGKINSSGSNTFSGSQVVTGNINSSGTNTFSGTNVVSGTLSLSTALGVASGGTGNTALTAENVLVGNGTSAIKSVAPGTSGNALVSNGSVWSSGSPAKLSTASGNAPSYSARAWVNFDGTASPITIRASGNVSSITDGGTGVYTINFTTEMANANYACTATVSDDENRTFIKISEQTTSNASFIHVNTTNTPLDDSRVCVAVFR